MWYKPISDWISQHPLIAGNVAFLGVILVAWVAYRLSKRILLPLITRFIKRSVTRIDDILFNQAVFSRLLYIIPALILYNFTSLLPVGADMARRILSAIIAWIAVITLGALLSAVNEVYESTAQVRRLHIKSYIQIAKLILYMLGGIVIIATLIGRSPWGMLSGIGALTAVLLLIFKDTILSLVASIQLNSNDMVRVGDWIEMPEFGADGDVIDMALHTIKIQNWDKTITTIPTYKLLEVSLKNWRGMSESGGRRIKRAIYIDMNTIKYCTDEMLVRFRKFRHITKYIELKQEELSKYNKGHQIDASELINSRVLTNIGTFRAYVVAYLRNHPSIHQEMTLIVRQLAPQGLGLPIEIYAFTNNVEWEKYESIQADIFDHILASIPNFDLRVFQNPSGNDFQAVLDR